MAMFCPNCGASMEGSPKFCWSCGAPMAGMAAPQQPMAPPQQKGPTMAPPPRPMPPQGAQPMTPPQNPAMQGQGAPHPQMQPNAPRGPMPPQPIPPRPPMQGQGAPMPMMGGAAQGQPPMRGQMPMQGQPPQGMQNPPMQGQGPQGMQNPMMRQQMPPQGMNIPPMQRPMGQPPQGMQNPIMQRPQGQPPQGMQNPMMQRPQGQPPQGMQNPPIQRPMGQPPMMQGQPGQPQPMMYQNAPGQPYGQQPYGGWQGQGAPNMYGQQVAEQGTFSLGPLGTDLGLVQMFLRYDGRLNRKPYIFRGLALFAVIVIASLIFSGIGVAMKSNAIAMLGSVVSLIAIVPSITLAIRRLHDLDRPTWWLVGMIIPVANFVLGLFLVFAKGTTGPNQYGPDPLEGQY